ncbi:MAG TPA: peptide ABC transporter permease [Microvirga sp.]|jgi:hypothetical protein
MARIPSLTAHPADDAAALLRRVGFTILMLGVPVTALVTRRAVVVMVPLGIVLLAIASAIDGGARPGREGLKRLFTSTGGLAGGLVVLWCALSLAWTPFVTEAAERLVNLVGIAVMAVVGYLVLPDRMRSANLYILPIGVGVAALCAVALAILGGSDEDMQNLDRGLVVLALLLWPAVAWLRSRGRHLESVLLALLVALATLLGPQLLPLQGLAIGAIMFGLTASNLRVGTRVTAAAMAGLLVLAPVLPFLLKPLASLVFGNGDPLAVSLDIWRSVVLDEPARLVTGHGFETALRGRFVGLLDPGAPSTLLFEVWYELGIVGAVAAAVALLRAAQGGGHDHPLLVPGIMAAYATAFALACLGIGTAQVWWFTALTATVLVFVAAERGQFRTTRPKAMLLRGS